MFLSSNEILIQHANLQHNHYKTLLAILRYKESPDKLGFIQRINVPKKPIFTETREEFTLTEGG
jgi:hypothetical protein